MKKRVLSLALACVILLSMTSVVHAKELTDKDVTQTLTDMRAIYHGKYWNGKLSENALQTAVDNGYSDPNASFTMSEREMALGITGSKCSASSHSVSGGTCNSNKFGDAWQCMGFGRYIHYVLFGVTTPTASSMNNGGTKKGFTKYEGSLLNDIALQAGDYIRTKNHSAVVWKVENGKIYVVEALGGNSPRCKINWGIFESNIGPDTPVELLEKVKNEKGHVIRPTSYINYSGVSGGNTKGTPSESTLYINLVQHPSSLKQGSSFGLRGEVTSNYTITEVVGEIWRGSDKLISSLDKPNRTSLDVKTANLNKQLLFGSLTIGTYKLVVRATDNTGKSIEISKVFSITSEQQKAESTLFLNIEQYPVTIVEGSNFGLRGTIGSNYNISEVCGYVKDSSGNVILSSKDYPNLLSVDIRYADLNNSLKFGKLSAGNYVMEIVAFDITGRKATVTKDFTVQGQPPYEIPVVPSNGVTGIVNIPSNWDNLSIRSGPGTSYPIIGSMDHGVSCTVYTDQTKNGWYYVNYNGVTGYASGNQIDINGESSNSDIKVGVVNIPSSWENLSIRTGPGTNYPIIGSMKNGARCNVYLSETSNGWYYVEYNGIKGYASGNTIDLQ